MLGKRLPLPWLRRKEPAPAATPPAAPPPPPRPAPPLARPQAKVRHEWLTVTVARATPRGPIPLSDARVVVRPWPLGDARPGDPLARATTGPNGAATLLLPTGRYAVSATHGGQTKAVALTLDHAGRAHVLLDSAARLAALAVDGAPPGAEVQARDARDGGLRAALRADDHGFALLPLPPGTYDVAALDASGEPVSAARVTLLADTRLHLPAGRAPDGETLRRLHEAAATGTAYPAKVAREQDAPRWN